MLPKVLATDLQLENTLYDHFFSFVSIIIYSCKSQILNYDLNEQGFIILSCLIAVSVNFSTFLVIGKTSPVTYQVLGHLKTCLVLGFGYTLLHDPFTERNIIGITIAVFGMGLYSYFCTNDNKKKGSVPGELSTPSQVFIHLSHFYYSQSFSYSYLPINFFIDF